MILSIPQYIINSYPRTSALTSGIIAALAHAPYFFTPGILGFSFLLFLVYSASSSKKAFTLSFLFGLGYFGFGFYWSTIALSIFIEDFWWAIPIAFLGLPSIFCIFIYNNSKLNGLI